MIVLGLTGSIAMGKSKVSEDLKRNFNIPVWDADEAVHEIQKDSFVVQEIQKQFPTSIVNQTVDRKRLGAIVFKDAERMRHLEEILYPLLRKHRDRFIAQCHKGKEDLCVLEVPLLFEKGMDSCCDKTLVVSCAVEMQQERLNRRKTLSKEQIQYVLDHQTPDAEKRRRADFIVQTDGSKEDSFIQMKAVLEILFLDKY